MSFEQSGSPQHEDGVDKEKNSMLLMEYKQKIPRRSQKAKTLWFGLSSISWVFLSFALLQGILVSGSQIAIAITGRGRLEDNVECLELGLSHLLNYSVTIPANSSIPNFGDDKQIYAICFIGLVIYNFVLVLYALTRKNIVEVYSFIIVNLLLTIYAFFQVYQFRGFGSFCDRITIVGYIALTNSVVLLVFTVVFCVLSLFIYAEFGWQVFVLVNGNPAMRYYYRVFRAFMSVVKLVIIFMILFSIGQCILVLPPENYEFGLTILIILVCFLALPTMYIVVTSEIKLGAAGILFLAVCLVAYFIFKIYRFHSGTCPVCQEQVRVSEKMRGDLLREIGLSDQSDVTIPLTSLTRAEDFEQLTYIAAVGLMFSVAALVIYIHYLRYYGKGLKELFADHWLNVLFRRIFCSCRKSEHSNKKGLQ